MESNPSYTPDQFTLDHHRTNPRTNAPMQYDPLDQPGSSGPMLPGSLVRWTNGGPMPHDALVQRTNAPWWRGGRLLALPAALVAGGGTGDASDQKWSPRTKFFIAP